MKNSTQILTLIVSVVIGICSNGMCQNLGLSTSSADRIIEEFSQIGGPCIAGEISPLANDTICCWQTIQLSTTGFSIDNGDTITWAITPESYGAVTNSIQLQDAYSNGWLQGIYSLGEFFDFTRNCASFQDSVSCNSFYFTPLVVETPVWTPMTYDPIEGCSPSGQICPSFSGIDSNWEILPWTVQSPDGTTTNINDQLAFGLPIDQPLLDLAGGLPCIDLSTLYNGNPNGTWVMNLTNTGTSSVDFGVPDFLLTNLASACSLISVDETNLIIGGTISIAPGETGSLQFTIPQALNYPVIGTCEAYGQPSLLHFADCFAEITGVLLTSEVIWEPTLQVWAVDISITGGTNYGILWDNGFTGEDLVPASLGLHTITVTDTLCTGEVLTYTETVDVGNTVGLNDEPFKEFSVYPNPFTTNLTIDLPKNHTYTHFTVSDLLGRQVAVVIVEGKERLIWNSGDLPEGVYVVSAIGEKEVQSFKVVKQS